MPRSTWAIRSEGEQVRAVLGHGQDQPAGVGFVRRLGNLVERQHTHARFALCREVRGLSDRKVNKFAPFSVTGKINPLASDLFVDLAISLKDNTLTPGSPYAAKYVGYPLENGALSLDLQYHVTQHELKAQNKVRVDQLRLGDASNSPDAIKLPVKLGIALLQDRHGVIALDVPLTGRLDDPKFKLMPLVMQVFMNVFTKAMTKPFAMLGSMFGGGEDLDHIAFDLGKADFTAGEVSK